MTKYYVGYNKGNPVGIFTSEKTPTRESHGKKYPGGSVGPFRTRAGAQVMIDGGYGNPHTQTVAQCERIAKTKPGK
jgi:hypothetical protein